MITGRRILVTGATGFIGRALIAHLVADGTVVTAAARGEASFSPHVRFVRIADVGPDTDWRDALAGCDVVVHLAARVHQMHDRAPDDLAEYRRVNCVGTMSLARQAAASGVSRFVYISSIKVNGESTRVGMPFTEKHPTAPVDAYGVSKAEAEAQLLALAATGALAVTIIRPPLVYGLGVRANFLSMMRWLSSGIPLPFGAITGNRRSLVGLDNLVSMICLCLEHPSAVNQVFLVSDGEDLSTADLLRRTARAMNIAPRLVPVPVALLQAVAVLLGKGAAARRLCGNLQVDAEKAYRLLGWAPIISVDEGLRRAAQLPPPRISP